MMNFTEFLNQAWADHGTKAELVAEKIPQSIGLIDSDEQIGPMAHLVTHVFGEHLGKWEKGISILESLRNVRCFVGRGESQQAIERCIASLRLSHGQLDATQDLSTSDRIRAFAVAASALSFQNNPVKAQELFNEALKAADSLPQDDPANRALAVAGNNLACSLEEKEVRSKSEVELMILAAETGRKYWGIAGTWLQVERAEYRLSQTYLKAGDLAKAFTHAKQCLEVVQTNLGPALERFFAFEALAVVEKSRRNHEGFLEALSHAKAAFSELTDADREWCEVSLNKLAT